MEEMVVERDICWEELNNEEAIYSIDEVINGPRTIDECFDGFEYILNNNLK